MKKFVVPALAVAALAGSAFGQAPVQLELRIVPQTGTLPGAITDVASSPTITTVGDVRRFEVQYRILDLNTADTIVPAGLVSGNLRITITGSGFGNSTLGRAQLSRFEAQLAASTPPTSPDSSGNATVVSTAGLHRPFRGGIPVGGTNPPAPNNDNPANGTFSANNTVLSGITPLSLSQNDQGNANVVADPMAWYGLYSFTLTAGSTAGAGTAVLTASFDADATTGNRFGYFNDGDPVPQTSSNAQSSTLNQVINIPAPGTMALLGLGGLIAARRRRA